MSRVALGALPRVLTVRKTTVTGSFGHLQSERIGRLAYFNQYPFQGSQHQPTWLVLLELREWPISIPPGTVPAAVAVLVTVFVEPTALPTTDCALLLVPRCEGSVAWDATDVSSRDDGGSEDSEIPESVTRKDCGSNSIDCWYSGMGNEDEIMVEGIDCYNLIAYPKWQTVGFSSWSASRIRTIRTLSMNHLWLIRDWQSLLGLPPQEGPRQTRVAAGQVRGFPGEALSTLGLAKD